ncbi:MAG: hypothetical protein U0Q22_10780 [Acidimicrobiales bacterium]
MFRVAPSRVDTIGVMSCPSCHFLLGPGATQCQFCKRTLVAEELPAELVAVASAASFTAAAPDASEPAAAPAPSSTWTPMAAPTRMSAAVWDRSAPGYVGPAGASGGSWAIPGSPASRHAKRRKIAIVVATVAVLGILAAFVVGAVSRSHDDASAPTWAPYTSRDGSFTATAPGRPSVHRASLPQTDGSTLTQLDYTFTTGVGSDLVVRTIQLRPEVISLVGVPSLLAMTLGDLAKQGYTIGQQTLSTAGADAANAFTATRRVGSRTYDVRGQVFVHGLRTFVVLTDTRSGTTDGAGAFERFMASFQPAG